MHTNITLEEVKSHPEVIAFIEQADKFIEAIGYTEHGFRHASLVSNIAQNVMLRLAYSQHQTELAAISGYLHDIGNVIGRENHGVSGALIARDILKSLGLQPVDVALVMSAIGNHEEEYGWATNEISAALILADKSDVHMTRVRNFDQATFDIHDRVNYAAKKSFLRVNEEERLVTLEIEIDTALSQVMEYFEIFLSRMVMCRRAAEYLNAKFSLLINENKLL